MSYRSNVEFEISVIQISLDFNGIKLNLLIGISQDSFIRIFYFKIQGII